MQSIYTDASVYKLLTPQDDAEHAFMCRLAGDAASILELASGCGNRQRAWRNGASTSTRRRWWRWPRRRTATGPACALSRAICARCGWNARSTWSWPSTTRCSTPAPTRALYAALDSIKAHMGPLARAVPDRTARARDAGHAESCTAEGRQRDRCLRRDLRDLWHLDVRPRHQGQPSRVRDPQGWRQGGRAHADHAHPGFGRAPAAGARGFSIARAFDESGQEVEPQARPGPTHAVRTYADRAPRAP